MRILQLTGWLSVGVVLLATIAIWVMFGLAGLTYNGATGGWHFNAGPVVFVGIGGGLLAGVVTTVLLSRYRPDALRGWPVWASAVVLAMLAFVTVLLVMKGLEPWAWAMSPQGSRRFAIAGRIAIGIAVTSVALGCILRRRRNGVVAVWLVGGTLVALVGLYMWMSWSHAIP